MYQIEHGDCLQVLRGMDANSVDSIVTDPPYGLSFMGKRWDYDVPNVEIWEECLRVLKPGGHLLAFAGTRTQHRMAVRIEDAGFEIRDMIAWVYGCLSEDSEVLTEDGWMPYNRATQKNILAYDLQNDIYQWERPSRWNEYRVESDTAYRIQSDHTDQIVSRGHRCIVERGGMLAFVPADELAGVERVPYLHGDFSALPQGRGELLLKAVLREGEGLAQAALSERQGEETSRQGACWGEKPGVEGRRDLLQTQGQVCGSIDQVCALPGEHDDYGAQGRVCDGASPCRGAGNWQATDSAGMRAPHQPRCDGQQAGKPDAVCDQCGSQAVRARASYQTTVATVTAIEYSGLIWCPTVSTGAFVARRNGKVFITGNSGFPKSHNVGKSIDREAGAQREVVGKAAAGSAPLKRGHVNTSGGGLSVGTERSPEYDITAPATDAARQWQGWGTALKPALEPITVARKALVGTVAANVLAHGTGALNIDGCRVPANDKTPAPVGRYGGSNIGPTGLRGERDGRADELGRWPANLIHDGSDEVLVGFPQTGPSKSGGKAGAIGYHAGGSGACRGGHDDNGGSAARFFYCAKASKRDRNEGCDAMPIKRGGSETFDKSNRDGVGAERMPLNANIHPTVKPTDLMAYLVRLVTPPGGTVLDPFMGSGSTGKAALREGFRFIGIELHQDYITIAEARLLHAIKTRQPAQSGLFY